MFRDQVRDAISLFHQPGNECSMHRIMYVHQCRLAIGADIAGKPKHIRTDKTELLLQIFRPAVQPEIDKVNLQMRMIYLLFEWKAISIRTDMNNRNIAMGRRCLTMALDKIPQKGIMTSRVITAKPNDLPHDT